MMLRGVYVVRQTRVEGGRVLHTCTSPGEEEGFDFDGVPAVGQGGLVCRPAPPDADGQVEAIVADEGGSPVIVGMRDTRADKVAGNLDEGDYCYTSPQGRCGLWCKGSGVVSLRKDGAGGGTDAFIQIEADGKILMGNQWGGAELGPNGWLFYTATGEAITLTAGLFQALAAQVALASATTSLHAAAARPLTFIPTSGVAGPAPNVFV